MSSKYDPVDKREKADLRHISKGILSKNKEDILPLYSETMTRLLSVTSNRRQGMVAR